MKNAKFLILALATSLFALPADDVVPIPNREYVPALHEALSNAKKSIHVLMFTARYYNRYPNDANSVILRDLIEAKKRGVDVKVILDASNWNISNTINNKRFGDTLASCGVEVYYDSLDVTTHCKMLIVDGYITILGSTNWSYFALEKNNEAAVLIRSKAVADYFENYFQRILKSSRRELPEKFQEITSYRTGESLFRQIVDPICRLFSKKSTQEVEQ